MKRLSTLIGGLWTRLRLASGNAPAYLLPFAVITLFLWWFCRVPNYTQPLLPDDWTPGCPKWESAWQTVPMRQQGRVTMHLAQGLKSNAEEIIAMEFSPHGQQVHRFDAKTGELLATSAYYSSVRNARVEGEQVRLTDYVRPGHTLSVYWLDRESLAEVRAVELDLEPLKGNTMSRSQLRALRELPNGDLVGVYGTELQPPEWDYAWFRADASGLIVQSHKLSANGSRPIPWPHQNPEVIVIGAVDPDADALCIDLLTGLVTDCPGASSDGDAAIIQPPPTTAPRRRGWVTVTSPEERRKDYPTAIPVLTHPYIFGRHRVEPPDFSSEPPIDFADECSRLFANLRRATWRQIWSDEYIEDHGDQAYRLDGVLVYGGVANPSLRMLEGELLQSVRCQPLVNAEFREALARQGGNQSISTFPRAVDLRIGLKFHEWRDGHLLVSQTLTQFPKHLTDAPAMWRVGLLEVDSTTVRWLGWIPLNDYDGPHSLPRIEILDEKLIIYRPGIFNADRTGRTEVNRPFMWHFIPLPAAMAELPEGPMR